MTFHSLEHGKLTIKTDNKSGVYFLKVSGEIVYIGKSVNVLSRVFGADHLAKLFDEVEIHWMPVAELVDYERTQIKIR